MITKRHENEIVPSPVSVTKSLISTDPDRRTLPDALLYPRVPALIELAPGWGMAPVICVLGGNALIAMLYQNVTSQI